MENSLTRFVPLRFVLLLASILLTMGSCGGEVAHTADAVDDSIAFMTAHGVSTLISDSGVIRYKIIAEEWLIYNTTPRRPSRWDFLKGFFMQRYDDVGNTELFIQSDTAFCHHDDLWELRGRVQIRNLQGTVFRTEELFWNMTTHELYSTLFVHIQEPDRELQGYNFTGNDQLTRYSIHDSSGMLPVDDVDKAEPDSIQST